MAAVAPYPGFLDFLVDQYLLTEEEVEQIRTSTASSSGRLGRLLLRERVLNMSQMVRVLRMQRATGKRIGDLAVEMGFASRAAVERVAAMQTVPREDAYDMLLTLDAIDREELFEAMLVYLRMIDQRFPGLGY